MANEYKSIYTGEEVDNAVAISQKAITSDNVVQSTGPSQTNVMSQAAVTSALQNIKTGGSIVTTNGVEQTTWETNTKVNVNQGTENAGKILGINAEGNVIPQNNSGGINLDNSSFETNVDPFELGNGDYWITDTTNKTIGLATPNAIITALNNNLYFATKNNNTINYINLSPYAFSIVMQTGNEPHLLSYSQNGEFTLDGNTVLTQNNLPNGKIDFSNKLDLFNKLVALDDISKVFKIVIETTDQFTIPQNNIVFTGTEFSITSSDATIPSGTIISFDTLEINKNSSTSIVIQGIANSYSLGSASYSLALTPVGQGISLQPFMRCNNSTSGGTTSISCKSAITITNIEFSGSIFLVN